MPEAASRRSGAVRLSRRRELSMAGLSWAARGLLHRLAIDVAWRPRTLRTVAGQLHLDPGEALVSLAAYAREAGGTWRTVRKLLDELAAAGWVEARTGPDGTVVRLLARLDVDPAEGGGVCSADTTPSAQRAQPSSNTPAVAPQGKGNGGCCLRTWSLEKARARDVAVAGRPSATTGTAGETNRAIRETNRAAGGTMGPSRETAGGSSPPSGRPEPPPPAPVAATGGLAAPAPLGSSPPLGLPRAIAEACRRTGIPPGLARELLDRGYDEAHVLGRLLQLAEALAGGRAVRSPPAWLRDKVRRGHAPEDLHAAAKRLLGDEPPRLPLSWLPAQAEASGVRVDRGPEHISEVLARALSPPAKVAGA